MTMQPQAQLSPPWYKLANELTAALTPDKEVQVSPLEQTAPGAYAIRVTTANAAKGGALAYLLNPTHQLGNITVAVGVFDASGKKVELPVLPDYTDAVPKLFDTAFAGNPLYKGVETRPLLPGRPAAIFPIYAARAIQFYNDNLADFWGNANMLAAQAFTDILRPLPNAGPYPCTEKLD